VVAEHDDGIGARLGANLEMIAAVGAPVANGRDAGPFQEERGHLVSARVAARLVQGRGLGGDEPLERGEHGGPVDPLHRRGVHPTCGKSRSPDIL